MSAPANHLPAHLLQRLRLPIIAAPMLGVSGPDLVIAACRAGVDGLVLLTAGAGGHTGWLNPFAYVRAVRRMFDGPIVLAGGMVDGVALRAAQAWVAT